MTRGLIGDQIGNYRLTQLLGRGKLADVYLGQHVSDQSLAAVKLFRMKVTNNDTQNFLYDTQSIATLQNRHILPVLASGVEDGYPFIVMDYAPHGTFRQRYPHGTHLPFDKVVNYVNQIADALACAHNSNLIHGEVKPENILVGQKPDDVLLSDFGIAILAQVRNGGRFIGTVIYMAPEQLIDMPVPASDQYALGIITYEWLRGYPPFHGNFAEIVRQHLSGELPPLQERLPEVSYAVDGVLSRALAKNPRDRFASVQDFSKALEQAYWLGQKTAPFPVLNVSDQESATNMISQPTLRTKWKDHLFSELAQLQSMRSSRRTVLISLMGLAGIAISEAAAGQTGASLQRPGSTLFTYHGHSSKVLSVQWSPNDQYVASGGNDGTVQIWQPNIDYPLLTYHGHHGVVKAVAWSPDGKYIASGGEDGTVHIWLASSLGDVTVYKSHSDAVNAVVWSPDGKYIASAGRDKTVRIWLANDSDRSGDVVYLHNGSVNALMWSDDGKYIASASDDDTARIWDVHNQYFVFTKVHKNSVLSVALEAGSKGNIAASGGDDNQVHVWDFNLQKRLLTYLGHANRVNSIVWSTDGQQIISASADRTVQIWSPMSSMLFLTYQGHTDEVFTAVQSHSGKFIASGSLDTTVQIWRAI